MKYCWLFIVLLTTGAGSAQTKKTKDFYATLKKFDLSKLWCADSFLIFDCGFNEKKETVIENPSQMSFPEPLGFIGSDYQRFYIHYLSVTRSRANAYLYYVTGKNKVKNNICDFRGTITVKTARLDAVQTTPKYKQGVITGTFVFYEDSAQMHSGLLSGTVITNFLIDSNSHILYDVLAHWDDDFRNNQCTGTWKSYKGNLTKKCNWGDFRVPESADLDVGVGEFAVNEKYIKNGWNSYMERAGDGVTEVWWK